jgi:hypothetical protein
MIVQFKRVRSSFQEAFERNKQEDIQSIASLEFFREDDYIADIFIEMNDVVDFVGGRTYCNDSMYECVYARLSDESYTDNILISPEEFKILLEKVRNIKIKSADEILNE